MSATIAHLFTCFAEQMALQFQPGIDGLKGHRIHPVAVAVADAGYGDKFFNFKNFINRSRGLDNQYSMILCDEWHFLFYMNIKYGFARSKYRYIVKIVIRTSTLINRLSKWNPTMGCQLIHSAKNLQV